MDRTKTLWLGWLCLIVNGYEVLAGLQSGQMGGLASISNPDSPPSFADRPGTFLFFMAIYLGLSGIGLWMIMRARSMANGGK